MAEEKKTILLNGGREVEVTVVTKADDFLNQVVGDAPAKAGLATLQVVKNTAGKPFVAVLVGGKHVGFLSDADAQDLFPTLADCEQNVVVAQAKGTVTASQDGTARPVLTLSLAEPGQLLGALKAEAQSPTAEVPKVESMLDQYCRTCGKGLPADARFCLECGAAVVAASAPAEGTTAPTPVLPVAPRVAPLPGQVAPRAQFSGTPTKGRGWWGRRSGLQKAGVIVGAIAVLVIIGTVAGTAGDKDMEAVVSSSTTVAVSTVGTSAKATTSVTSAPTITTTAKATTTEKEKAWTEVVTLSGNGNKRSSSFTLSGAEARLRYTVEGQDMVIAAIYVVEEGTSLQESGGFPEVTATAAGSDETYLQKSAGEYYLDVTAANCSWTVTIEELR